MVFESKHCDDGVFFLFYFTAKYIYKRQNQGRIRVDTCSEDNYGKAIHRLGVGKGGLALKMDVIA